MLPVNWLFGTANQGSTPVAEVIDPVVDWLPVGYTYVQERDLIIDPEGAAVSLESLASHWTTTEVPIVMDARGGESEVMIDTGLIGTQRLAFYVRNNDLQTVKDGFAVLVAGAVCRVDEVSSQPVGAPQWARIQVSAL